MLSSVAEIETAQAQRLINRLCKHWQHKFAVHSEASFSQIDLPRGICRLYGGEVLRVELSAEPEQMAGLQQVVTDHLQRMAAGQQLLRIEWA